MSQICLNFFCPTRLSFFQVKTCPWPDKRPACRQKLFIGLQWEAKLQIFGLWFENFMIHKIKRFFPVLSSNLMLLRRVVRTLSSESFHNQIHIGTNWNTQLHKSIAESGSPARLPRFSHAILDLYSISQQTWPPALPNYWLLLVYPFFRAASSQITANTPSYGSNVANNNLMLVKCQVYHVTCLWLK